MDCEQGVVSAINQNIKTRTDMCIQANKSGKLKEFSA